MKKKDNISEFIKQITTALNDAVMTGHMTQLKINVTNQAGGESGVQIIIVPDDMEKIFSPGN